MFKIRDPRKLLIYLLLDTTQLLVLGKLGYGWGPIFKVVLEC